MEQDVGAEQRRAVVLLSGGLDSATALAVARAEERACYALSVDYGQRHIAELACARRVGEALGVVSHAVVKIDLRVIGGSALTGDMEVPKGRSEGEIARGIPVTYVPARNMVLLSAAVACAESVGAGEVFIGVNQIDYSGYPDCREEFIRAFEVAAKLGTKAGVEGEGIRIRTPLVALSKAGIIRLGTKLGVDFAMTTSCYDPVTTAGGEVLACGRCDSCTLRRRGFEDAGVADPTRYAS